MKYGKQWHFTLWKSYEQGAPWKKQYHFLIDGVPTISKIRTFKHAIRVSSDELNLKNEAHNF